MINIQHSRWLALCIIVIVSMCFAGCSAALLSPDETPLFATPTFSPIVVSLPSPEPLTRTPTPSPVPATRTPYPTQTPSPTLVPTLTADEERAFVVEMLETNGGCELSCWWGIVPGETDWQTVRNLFASLGKRTNDVPYPAGTVGHGSRNFEVSHSDHPEYYIAHTFVERDGIVQSIEVIGSVVKGDPDLGGGSSHFAQDWRRYSLDQVLTRYGEPSQVRISFVPPIALGAFPYYNLALVYDHLGFFISYEGLAVYEPSVMQVCPRLEEVTLVFLHLQVPRSGKSILEPQEEYPYPTLEEATGMEVETFYETFRNVDSNVCLESPAEMWP